MKLPKRLHTLSALFFLILGCGTAHAGKVLDAIKERGTVNCGVHTGRAGFALAGNDGNWSGLDVDYCRALAAAVLGDASKVKFVPTSPQTRFAALQAGEIDVLARNTTWQIGRDTSLGLLWVGINFHDGQAFIVRKGGKLNSVKQLNGAAVCVDSGSTSEKTLADYTRTHKLNVKTVVFDNPQATLQAFESGRCQALTKDFTALAVARATELKNPENYVILPEVITKEPLGPAVKRGDEEWFSIARWTLNAMVEAEELGIHQKNVDALRQTAVAPEVKRFVGTGEDLGKGMGLDKEWSYRIVKQVGNYGESFDRNLGNGSTLRLARGQMKLWKDGGLMYSPPMR